MIRSLTAAGGAPDKMISPITPEQAALYEIHSSWWAQWVFWSWGQDLAGSYFAWKVRRKWKRYRKSVTAHNKIALRKLGWTVAGAVLLLFGGCGTGYNNPRPSVEPVTPAGMTRFDAIPYCGQVIHVRDCDYIIVIGYGLNPYTVHAGDCPNPIHQCPPCQ